MCLNLFASLPTFDYHRYMPRLGGLRQAAEILSGLDPETSARLLARIERENPVIAEQLRKLMFTFEDLGSLQIKDLSLLLREIPQSTLAISMKLCSEELNKKIFSALTRRQTSAVEEARASLGPTRKSAVEKAQQEIIDAAKNLGLRPHTGDSDRMIP